MRKSLFIFLLIFTVVTGYYFISSWLELPEDHRYIYPLDDVYIHLALAKNFATNGVWSVNSTGFDSASSSILYTLILSFLIKIFGDWEYYPLLINVLFSYLSIFVIYRYFKDFFGKRELVLAFVLLIPFSMLYMSLLLGMEHTIHMFLMVLVIYLIQKNIRTDFKRKDFIFLLIVVFFISIIRFESMFFTLSLSLALFLRKRMTEGISVLVVGFSSIIVFGLISLKCGGFFFPNSVVIKGSFPAGTHFLKSCWIIFTEGILFNTSFYKCLFFPFLIIALYLWKKYKKRSIWEITRNETIIITLILTGIFHSLFAFLKYRYENYLMISMILLFTPVIIDFWNEIKSKKFKLNMSNLMMLGSIVFVFLVSIYRFWYHDKPLKLASKGINEQQIEMSRFLGNYYKGQKIIANDIGAISYFSHVQLLDMVGLGSTDVAKMKVANKHNTRAEYIVNNKKFITGYAAKNNYKIAVIYPEWFPGNPPSTWLPVASWTIKEKYGPAIRRVVFYAVDPSEKEMLQRKLSQFDLNPNVQEWFYVSK